MSVIHTKLNTVHGTRWRILAGTVALGALSLVTAGCFRDASAVSSDDSLGGTALVECRSGIVTDGDVQTSSMSVTKVDAAHVPELPGGCSVTP
jgi:hypothetical protein